MMNLLGWQCPFLKMMLKMPSCLYVLSSCFTVRSQPQFNTVTSSFPLKFMVSWGRKWASVNCHSVCFWPGPPGKPFPKKREAIFTSSKTSGKETRRVCSKENNFYLTQIFHALTVWTCCVALLFCLGLFFFKPSNELENNIILKEWSYTCSLKLISITLFALLLTF